MSNAAILLLLACALFLLVHQVPPNPRYKPRGGYVSSRDCRGSEDVSLVIVSTTTTRNDALLLLPLQTCPPRETIVVVSNCTMCLNATRTKGAAMATGRVVAFADGNDAMLPTRIQHIGRAFASNPRLQVFYHGFVQCGSDARWIRPRPTVAVNSYAMVRNTSKIVAQYDPTPLSYNRTSPCPRFFRFLL